MTSINNALYEVMRSRDGGSQHFKAALPLLWYPWGSTEKMAGFPLGRKMAKSSLVLFLKQWGIAKVVAGNIVRALDC